MNLFRFINNFNKLKPMKIILLLVDYYSIDSGKKNYILIIISYGSNFPD
jgi:hypothetical protein